jgi:hypothetical protein
MQEQLTCKAASACRLLLLTERSSPQQAPSKVREGAVQDYWCCAKIWSRLNIDLPNAINASG